MQSITATVFLITLTLLAILAWYKSKEHYENVAQLDIFIISLPIHKTDRLDPLVARLGGITTITRVVGVDGKSQVKQASNMRQGQVGCWLSHVAVWRQVKTMTLVLEDDANITFPQHEQGVQTIINELDAINPEWDMCYLGGRYADPESMVQLSTHIATSTSSRIWHSHAYLIKPKAATSLLKQSATFNHSLDAADYNGIAPVDDWMTDPSRGLSIYKAEPNLINFIDDNIHDTFVERFLF